VAVLRRGRKNDPAAKIDILVRGLVREMGGALRRGYKWEGLPRSKHKEEDGGSMGSQEEEKK